MGNSVFSARERNIIILIIVIVLGAILLYATRGLYGAFLGASIMYTLFRPLNKFFIERWNWPKAISAITIIVLSLVIIILPFLGIGSMLIRKAMELQQDRAWINKIIEAINNFAGDKLGIDHIGALFLAECTEGRIAHILHGGEQQGKIRQCDVRYLDQFLHFWIAKIQNNGESVAYS